MNILKHHTMVLGHANIPPFTVAESPVECTECIVLLLSEIIRIEAVNQIPRHSNRDISNAGSVQINVRGIIGTLLGWSCMWFHRFVFPVSMRIDFLQNFGKLSPPNRFQLCYFSLQWRAHEIIDPIHGMASADRSAAYTNSPLSLKAIFDAFFYSFE